MAEHDYIDDKPGKAEDIDGEKLVPDPLSLLDPAVAVKIKSLPQNCVDNFILKRLQLLPSKIVFQLLDAFASALPMQRPRPYLNEIITAYGKNSGPDQIPLVDDLIRDVECVNMTTLDGLCRKTLFSIDSWVAAEALMDVLAQRSLTRIRHLSKFVMMYVREAQTETNRDLELDEVYMRIEMMKRKGFFKSPDENPLDPDVWRRIENYTEPAHLLGSCDEILAHIINGKPHQCVSSRFHAFVSRRECEDRKGIGRGKGKSGWQNYGSGRSRPRSRRRSRPRSVRRSRPRSRPRSVRRSRSRKRKRDEGSDEEWADSWNTLAAPQF